MRKIIVILFFFAVLQPFHLYSKWKLIKKTTKITFDYSSYNRGGKIAIDTNYIYFDTLGNQIIPKLGHLMLPLDTIVLNSTPSDTLKKITYSDSGLFFLSKAINKDSTTETFLDEKRDTFYQIVNKFRRSKLIYERTKNYSNFYDGSICIKYHSNYIFCKRKDIEIHIYPNGNVDRYIYTFSKLIKKRKEYTYNESTKKWHISKKERFNRKNYITKRVTYDYNDYFKEYFKETQLFDYNSNYDLIYEIHLDELYAIDKIIRYSYEYY